ncbi:MAG: Protein often found in Actinomycetes clustered with signal peptidase and/or RNaseHII, partial [uncultured Acidimicrobiales bacterium]
ERRGSGAVRDRDRAPALPGVQVGPAAVPVRRRDGAEVLPGQRGRPGSPGRHVGSPVLQDQAQGRVGVGHVPSGPLREQRHRRHLQGRQRRGAPREGAV